MRLLGPGALSGSAVNRAVHTSFLETSCHSSSFGRGLSVMVGGLARVGGARRRTPLRTLHFSLCVVATSWLLPHESIKIM